MKKFLIPFLVTCLFASGTAVHADSIDVQFNSVKLKVNGNPIQTPNILWNGTTYVPLRAVSETLGCDVQWDEVEFTASVNQNSDYYKKYGEIMHLFNAQVALNSYEALLGIVDGVNRILSLYSDAIKINYDADDTRDTADIRVLNAYEAIFVFMNEQLNTDDPNELYAACQLSGFDYSYFNTSVQGLIAAVDNYSLSLQALDNFRNFNNSYYFDLYLSYMEAGDAYLFAAENVAAELKQALAQAGERMQN